MKLDHFREIWLVDFEFCALPGERPEPLCMVATEYHSGRTIRWWLAGGAPYHRPPFVGRDDVLVVFYFASADLGCFLALGWPRPKYILDLFAEFRVITNGLTTPCGNGLLGALAYFGLPSIGAAEKRDMRELAMRGGPHSREEQEALIAYCESDVQQLRLLLKAMWTRVSLGHALLRGRYTSAVASMEWRGTPIDVDTLQSLRGAWPHIRLQLIQRCDFASQLYDGTTFKADRFENLLKVLEIPWPRTSSGRLALDDDTFRQMSGAYPVIAPIRELRHTLSDLRLEDLTVGRDGRNRCLLSPFQSVTGRNQPSTTKFIFGNSVWLRGLIEPPPGQVLVNLDWSGQEYGIAAYLSRDPQMMADYETGDPYLGFGKRVRIVPGDATKISHEEVRNQLKIALGLGVMYGAGAESIAATTGYSVAHARELLRLHQETYRVFWDWSRGTVDHAMLHGYLHTCFGWRIQGGPRVNPRGLSNFLMQANAAEMLRVASCLAIEQGVKICCPIHDALLIETEIDSANATIETTRNVMREASRIVLDGHELRTDDTVVYWPGRYMDKRGRAMWETVMAIMGTPMIVGAHAP